MKLPVRQLVRYNSTSQPKSASKILLQPAPPSGLPVKGLRYGLFPLPLRDSFRQWLSRKSLKESEEELFDCVGLSPQKPQSPYRVKSVDVPVGAIGGRQLFMNELEVSQTDVNTSHQRHIIIVHGYGASKGYFYRNIKSLATPGTTVHALDWLGYGRSTRAPVDYRAETAKQGVLKAEKWFLDAFEKWRQQRNIPKFTLVAHSLGAYLGCAYASQHPERVEKMALVSPAGVNRTPISISAEDLYGAEADNIVSPVTSRGPRVPAWFQRLWERHWSPFSLVRNTGPLGPKITSGWASRRFSKLPRRDQMALQKYSYVMFNAKGSGEYLLNFFLAAGGVGRWPLAERLQLVKCPTLWLYGDRDWMDVNGGHVSVRRLRELGRDANLVTIKDSGHHLYLDNYLSFHEALGSFIESKPHVSSSN